MKEIARREGVDDSYVSRMINLTTLAPDIVAAILDEILPPEVILSELAACTPLLWRSSGKRKGGNLEVIHFLKPGQPPIASQPLH